MRPPAGGEALRFRAAFLAPRHWGIWLLVAGIWLLSHLPLRTQRLVGRSLGLLFYRLPNKRTAIARINIALCFPELDAKERDALCRGSMAALGTGIVETGMGWFASERRLRRLLLQVEGLETIAETRARGQGVLLLFIHQASLELMVSLIPLLIPDMMGMARVQKNPVIDYLHRGRSRFAAAVIPGRSARQMARVLTGNGLVLYAPDQDYGRKRSTFAPFFGVETATVTAPSRIARATGTRVMMCEFEWLGHGYRLAFKPLEGYPGDNDQAAALVLNQAIEELVRKHPADYLWQHRRFKTQPDNQASPYAGYDRSSGRKKRRRR